MSGTNTGVVKTTYTFSAFLTPFPSNFRYAWCQQAGEGGCYDTLAERYGERIRCFTPAPQTLWILVWSVTGEAPMQARVFVSGKLFQPNLIFASNAVV